MEFPNPFGLSELVEKAEAQYGARELALLRRMYPELGDKTPSATAKLFDINGKLLSVGSIAGLHGIFSDLSASKVSRLLKDDQAFMDAVDELAQTTKAERRRYWLVLSALPLSETARKHLENAFRDRSRPDSEPPAPESGESGEIVWVPMPAHLPYGNLPELETLLDASRKLKRAELPNADVYVIGPGGGFSQAVKLTNQETVAALQYVQGRLEHIKEERASLEAKYRQAKGLPKNSPVDAQEVKLYWLKRLTQKRLSEILGTKIGPLSPGTTLEVRFTQYRREMPSVVRTRVASSTALRGFYQQQISGLPIGEAGQQPEAQAAEAGSVRVPAQIPMTEIVPFLDADTFVLKEEQPIQEHGPKKFAASKGREVEKMNELQRAYSEISRATKSGDWSKAIEIYVKYLEFWPQYLEHRMGVVDIWKKHQAGILPRLPKNILSIASGPHEELRAQWDITDILTGGEMPHVVQLDASQEMLGCSLATLPRGAAAYATDLVGDMRDVAVGDAQFDMVECSSFDNLKEESDVKTMLAKAADRLAVGGIFRFMLNEPFTDQLCKVLEDHGFKVLDKNASVALAQDTANDIKRKRGVEVLKRIQDKLKRHKYFTAIKTKPTDQQALREALEGAAVYKAKRKNSVALAREVRAAASGEQKDQELDLATHLTVALNAPFFIERRGLKPEELAFSLRALHGNLDTASAIKLAQIFFTNPALAPYAHLVFEAVKNVPEVVGNLSVLLLEHSNAELAGAVEPLMVARPATYLIPVLESGLGQETKTQVVKRMLEQPQAIAKLEVYLQNHDGQEIVDLVFPLLPKGRKLSLPLAWRYDERLAGLYRTFATGVGKGERLSAQEAEQLAQMEVVPEHMRPFAFDHIVEKVRKDKDPDALLDLAQEAVEFAQKDGTWAEVHRKAVEKLFGALEKLSGEFNMDAAEIEQAVQLKKRVFGQDADVAQLEKALASIEYEKPAKDSVSRTLDRYLRRRGLADEYELKQDLWGMTERLAMEADLDPSVSATLLAAASRAFNKHTDKAVFLKGFAAGKFDDWSKMSKEEFWLERITKGHPDGFAYLSKNDPELARKAFDQAGPQMRRSLIGKAAAEVIGLFGDTLYEKYRELFDESWFVSRVINVAPEILLGRKDQLKPDVILELAKELPERITDEEFFKAFEKSDAWHVYNRIDKEIIHQALRRDAARALAALPKDRAIMYEALSGMVGEVLDAVPDFFASNRLACVPSLISEGLRMRFAAILTHIDSLPSKELREALRRCIDVLSSEQLSSLLAARPDIFDGELGERLDARNSDVLKDQVEKLRAEKQKVEDFLRGPHDASRAAEIDAILARQPNLLTLDLVLAIAEFDADTAVKWARSLPLNDLRKAVVNLWDKAPIIRRMLQTRPDILDSYDFVVDLLTVNPPMAGDLLKKRFSYYYGNIPTVITKGLEKWLASHTAQEIADALEGLDQASEYAMAYFDGLANKDLDLAIGYAQRHPEFEKRLTQKHAVAVILAHPEYFQRSNEIVVDEALARNVATENFTAAKRLLEKLQPEEVLRVLGVAVSKHGEDVALEIWRDYPTVRGNAGVLGAYIQRHPFLLIGLRNDIPEDVRKDVRKRLQANLARRSLAAYDAGFLQKLEKSGLNKFPIVYAFEQNDRSGKFVGYKVNLEGGIEVFVPGSLTHGLDRQGFDPQRVRLRLVPNARQDRVVGELVSPSATPIVKPEQANRMPEVKAAPVVDDARSQLLKRLVSRFDQRELASLEAQGLNYFTVKNLREQIRRQDGRRVGYMVTTDLGVEVFVPMSNVRVAPGDLRQTGLLEMRLQVSNAGDRVVGLIERSNPFRTKR